MVEQRELSDEPTEERRELGEESLAWPETWSSSKSSVMSLMRSDESSVRSTQRGWRCGRAARAWQELSEDRRELGDEWRELGDEQREFGDERRELGEKWRELGNEQRELGNEQRELGDEYEER
jgi:uncharacterized coiled-coil DUF342 family protein